MPHTPRFRRTAAAALALAGISGPIGATAAAQAQPAAAGIARPPIHRLSVAGAWSGGDWGDVVIGPDGRGSYSSTYGTGPGRLRVHVAGELRYEGTWSESSQRFGTLIIVLSADGQEATGRWTPDPQCTLGAREGGAITWTRRR